MVISDNGVMLQIVKKVMMVMALNGTDGDDCSNTIMGLMRAQVVFITCSMPTSSGEVTEMSKKVA